MKRVAVFICLHLVSSCLSQLFEGDICNLNESNNGICTLIQNCPSALADIRAEKYPVICSFSGVNPVVCCADNAPTPQITTSTAPPPPRPTHAPTTPPPPQTFTPMLDLSESRFSNNIPREESTTAPVVVKCPAIPPNKTAARTGQKAWDKCIEYQETLVMPCEKQRRLNLCRHDLNLWILGGSDTYDGEFPHMALVGFHDGEKLSLLCGGSLISDRFVMTAGHCTTSRGSGAVSHVVLGALNRTSYEPSQLHRVRAVYVHPGYKPPAKYNDIALLKLEEPLKLSDQLVPACLDVGGESHKVATATGWGTTQYQGNVSDVLQKVELTQFSSQECSTLYLPTRNLRNGFNTSSQLCYGDRNTSKDTCQGDSGGPLQVQHPQLYCMYSVLGVTSFGRKCGVVGDPALYTRVAHYLPWLEAIVWPDE